MTDLELEETSTELRTLVLTAAPAVHAPPDLAARVLARPHRTRRRRVVAGLGVLVVVGAVAAAALPGHGDFKHWEMPSGAMQPTVQTSQQVLVRKGAVPERGEVVLTTFFRPSGGSYEALERVVGLAGDTVSCPDRGDGTCDAVEVSGVPLREPYLDRLDAHNRTDPFTPISVGPGQLFLMGDHRPQAYDSRFTGPQPIGNVEGVVVARVTPTGLERLPNTPERPLPEGSDVVDPAAPPGAADVASD